MTREEFAKNWMEGNRFVDAEGVWYIQTKRCFAELLGSIYDLQQQIIQLQEQLDEHKL